VSDKPKTYATLTFTADGGADPLVFAFQAARLAVIEAAARRQADRYVPQGRLSVTRPAPTLLILTVYEDDLAAIMADLVKAQVFGPVELEVSDTATSRPAGQMAAQDFAEYLRDRFDGLVVLARPARQLPGC
jgi:hypothetical protein